MIPQSLVHIFGFQVPIESFPSNFHYFAKAIELIDSYIVALIKKLISFDTI